MKRLTLLTALALAALSAVAAAQTQLVPLSQCGAALPCSIPVGLRPADAAAASPYGRVGAGNTLVSMAAAVDEPLKPRLVTRVAEDPSERAARLFLRRNPSLGPRKPAPAPPPAVPSSPENLQLP